MTLSTGQMGSTQLLAQLLASIEDPHDVGVGAGEIVAAKSGVSAQIHMPSGDRYIIVVQWIGDQEEAQ